MKIVFSDICLWPPQYLVWHLTLSRLENPREWGAWWAAIYGVVQSRTWLKWLSSLAAGAIILCCKFTHLCYRHHNLILFIWSPVSGYLDWSHFVFSITVFLMKVTWYFIEGLIFIYLMTNDIEHFSLQSFICLLWWNVCKIFCLF